MRKGTKIILGVAAGAAAVVGVGVLLNYLQQRDSYDGYLDDDYEDEDDYEYEYEYEDEDDFEEESYCAEEGAGLAEVVKQQICEETAVEDTKEESTSEEIPVEEVMQ